MTWTCTPEHDVQETQFVQFRFVENPHYHQEAAGPGLCDALKARGTATVKMHFEVLGDVRYRADRSLNIEGLSTDFVDAGGGYESGPEGPGIDPLATAYNSSK